MRSFSSRAFGIAAIMLTLAGCATTYGRGDTALRAGRYGEAATHFEAALAGDPHRLDAQAGLGVARYKLGIYPRAVEILSAVVAEAPRNTDARLYLALSRLAAGEDDAAREDLVVLRALDLHPRVAEQVGAALEVMKLPLAPSMRSFVRTSLEHELEWARDLHDARRAPRVYLQPTWVFEWDERSGYYLQRYPYGRSAP